RLASGNKRMAAYGWRHSNWLEAKFFRAFDKDGNPKRSTNQAIQTAALLADLLRLSALGRREIGKDDMGFSSRYLLHVYLREVADHLCMDRNPPKAERVEGAEKPKGQQREWISALITPGRQNPVTIRIGDETKTIRKSINPHLNDITLQFGAENLVITPSETHKNEAVFACILTR